MSRYGYSKLHKYKSAVSRRLFVLRRGLSIRGNLQGTAAPASQACYWVGAGESTSWYDPDNWASSSAGTGGYGIPGATNPVVFDGGSDTVGPNTCVLTGPVSCAAFSITEAEATVAAEFLQNGKTINCTTFTYNVPTANSGEVFDGTINCSGATFTVTAAENADHFGTVSVVSTGAAFTVSSAVALASTTFSVAGDFTTGTALSVARLILTASTTQALTFLHGVNFTLATYTAGDWDGAAGEVNTIVSDDASTWGFVNPEGMVVSYINVEDSNATNAIDATDNCVDGTGNTNWTFA
jgi:hypothetical protein